MEAKVQDLQQLLEEKNEELLELQTQVSAIKSSLDMHLDLQRTLNEQSSQVPASQAGASLELQGIRGKRNPADMLRSQWKGMKLSDIIFQVLRDNAVALTTAELTQLMYSSQDEEEFNRARNSLSSELRSGAKRENPCWKKIGRNAYAAI